MYRVVEVGSFSFPMPTKESNEDSLLLPTNDNESNIVFAIADGVGSLQGAVQASMCVINAVQSSLLNQEFSTKNAFLKAKEDIDLIASKDEHFQDAATTLTVVHVLKNKVIIGHIGDCRAYVKKENKLVQLTKDHTRYQELVDSGEHSTRKLRLHKERLSSVLTKAVSSHIDLDFDIYEFSLNDLLDGDSVIITLMSDGAHSHWQKRPKFATSTMNTPSAFTNSLRRRIERNPSDDFSCLSIKIEAR